MPIKSSPLDSTDFDDVAAAILRTINETDIVFTVINDNKNAPDDQSLIFTLDHPNDPVWVSFSVWGTTSDPHFNVSFAATLRNYFGEAIFEAPQLFVTNPTAGLASQLTDDFIGAIANGQF